MSGNFHGDSSCEDKPNASAMRVPGTAGFRPRKHSDLRRDTAVEMGQCRQMKVLLVEDNAAQRELLSQILRPLAGVEIVAIAATQHEAVAWLRDHPDDWDLALIDLFLAQGNGFAVLRECAGRASTQKVVLMSNYADEPVRERAVAAGADAFFEKGAETSALLDFCIHTRAALAPG